MASRPRARAISISSRYGSHALAAGARPGGGHVGGPVTPGGRSPRSADTSLAGLGVASAGSESVDTPLAGFAGGWPYRPRGCNTPGFLDAMWAGAEALRRLAACRERRVGMAPQRSGRSRRYLAAA